MRKPAKNRLALLPLLFLIVVGPVAADGVSRDLPYPVTTPDAEEIARQVYFVNHFYPFAAFSLEQHPRGMAVIVNKDAKGSFNTLVVERHINNSYDDGVVKSKELAIFREGKLKATGMLIIDYEDDTRSHDHFVWLPELRKVRRFAQPAYRDAWGGTVFTYGDLTLRKPSHETHELLGTETFGRCLEALTVPQEVISKWGSESPGPVCDFKDKQGYVLKSTTRFDNWWYDYRISFVDTRTFADYRTEYYKDGKLIKFIDRDWRTLGMDDPRAQYWASWYGKNLRTGNQSMIIVPRSALAYSANRGPDFWSEQTLRKLHR